MNINATTGQQNTTDGNPGISLRLGRQADLITSELHGRYFETNRNKNLFTGATQAPVATSVGLATASTGLCLTNPIGNTVNLVINKVAYAFLVAPAAALVVGIAVGYNGGTSVTQTSAISPTSQFVGIGTLPQAHVASSVTLPTAPVVATVLGTVAAAIQAVPSIVDLEGSIIIPPGGYAIIYTSAASAAAGFMGSFQWEEIPI